MSLIKGKVSGKTIGKIENMLEVAVLRHKGFSYEEIGEQLGIAASYARKLMLIMGIHEGKITQLK